MINNVILVDRDNYKIGVCEKLKAHYEGKLHRAFSIFIFNSKNELLLQQRALNKYHTSGLWSNTTCSHPKPNKKTDVEVNRRLFEEMGFKTDLTEIYSFIYKHVFSNGLIEHEFDQVFIGFYNQDPRPNEMEVISYKWLSLESVIKEIDDNPALFTPWLKILLNKPEFINLVNQCLKNP